MTPREKRLAAYKARQKNTEKYEGKALYDWLKPAPFKIWDWREPKKHMFDMVPYIAGNQHNYADSGDEVSCVDIFVHKKVGGGDESYICPKKTYPGRKLACPICEHHTSELNNGVDWKSLGEFRTTKYPTSIYCVVVNDSEEEKAKGIQIFIVPFFNMEHKLTELVQSEPQEIAMGAPPEKLYSDPTEDGYMISFTRKNAEGVNYETLAHQLIKRNYSVENLIESAPCLDELLVIPTYDELHEALYGERQAEPSPHTQQNKPVETKSEPMQNTPTNKTECPEGGEFGTSFYEFDGCETCDIYPECNDKSQQITTEKEAELNESPEMPEKEIKQTRGNATPGKRGTVNPRGRG